MGKVGRVQVRAVSKRPLPADMKLAVIGPGHAAHTATERAALDTSTMDGDNGADSVFRAVGPAAGHRRLGPARRRRLHAAPGDLLAGPVGRRRADAQQVVPALRRRARRLRAPHGQRQQLHAGRGAGAAAQHLRLPRAGPRLERHRLQLPRRPLRPDLGGPRTAASTARWSAPTPSATTTTRSPPRRSATTSWCGRARRCSRPTPRCSPGSSRLHGVDASSTRQYVTSTLVPGDQRPPRRGGHRLPGAVPLRQAPGHPEDGRGRPARLERAPARVQPRLDARRRTSSYAGRATARRSWSRPAA